MTHDDLPGSVWKHKKGALYRILFECVIEATQTPAIAYRHADGIGFIWIRPRREFLDGRFERCASAAPENAP